MMTEKDFQMDEKILQKTKFQCFQKLNSRWLLIVLCQFCFYPTQIDGQANAHAHNDYTRESPFYSAALYGFKSIEVDIFMIDDVIYVAHDKVRHSR
jgi:hypothetical protein